VSEFSSTCQVPVGAPRARRHPEHRLHHGRARSQARLGIEIADFGDHVGEVLLVDAAQAAERSEIALGQQSEILDQRAHGRIEAVAFLELDGETFGERARAHARWIERLPAPPAALDVFQRRAKFFGDRLEIAVR